MAVGVADGGGDAGDDGGGVPEAQLHPLLDDLLHVPAGDVLHGDEVHFRLGVEPRVMDGDDARVGEAARRPRLLVEALDELAALPGLQKAHQADGLDGQLAVDDGVPGEINHAHGPAADLPDDLIPADLLHAPILPRGRGEVKEAGGRKPEAGSP